MEGLAAVGVVSGPARALKGRLGSMSGAVVGPGKGGFKGKVYVSERLWGLRGDVSKYPAEPRLEGGE